MTATIDGKAIVYVIYCYTEARYDIATKEYDETTGESYYAARGGEYTPNECEIIHRFYDDYKAY